MEEEKEMNMMDLTYFSEYNPKLGFKFVIDGFHNLPENHIFCAIYCVYPPGTLYTENVDSSQVFFEYLLDWNSPISSPKFLESYTLF